MKNPQQQQRGQAILIMAFAVIALAALVGLAIDGGRLYTLRRQAQNAADATALAATRELASLLSKCASGTAAQNAAIFNTVLEYARLNGIDEFDPNGDVTAWYVDANENNLGSIRNDVPIPTGATGVTASMVTTDTTTFMKLFGQAHIVGVGQATAMTGRVTQYQGGFLPIAVPKTAVDGRRRRALSSRSRMMIKGSSAVSTTASVSAALTQCHRGDGCNSVTSTTKMAASLTEHSRRA